MLDQLGNVFVFLLLQDSQDSDDESKCLCEKYVLHNDISHQKPNSQNEEVNFFVIFREKNMLFFHGL